MPVSADLFDDMAQSGSCIIAPGASFFPGLAYAESLLLAIEAISAQAPFRYMSTPGGVMSVAITNCGKVGWLSDRKGYRYAATDPQTQQPWPAMPAIFSALAGKAAQQAGYGDFYPDVCLINRYAPGARMGLHQDKDEQDFAAPIVSVSLGLAASFMLGGLKRHDKVQRLSLQHGDVLVWGGASRLFFHGVAALKTGLHPLLGQQRINLTFRKAL